MVFKRRDKQRISSRLREMFAPRKGWSRGLEYVSKRMQRLPDTPHRIALGFACGVQASFTPLFGFHFVVAAALAWATRSNILASAFGTFVGNPVTFPFIAFASMWLGFQITGIHVSPPSHGYTFGWIWENREAIFLPYLVGGLLPGLVTSGVFYVLVRPLVAAYQNRRRNRLIERAKKRVREHKAARSEKKPLVADAAE